MENEKQNRSASFKKGSTNAVHVWARQMNTRAIAFMATKQAIHSCLYIMYVQVLLCSHIHAPVQHNSRLARESSQTIDTWDRLVYK